MSKAAAVILENITCDFPGVRALDSVSLQFFPGEVHALAGENGAGKSTLLKVLSGLVTPTQGKIRIGHQTFSVIRHAAGLGIHFIPQEPVLAPDLSIAENLLMGRLPKKQWGRIDWKKTYAMGRNLLVQVGLEHHPSETLVADLGIAEQQLVEIARALAEDGNIYLFDEPTSSLSTPEVSILAQNIRLLRQAGKTILYVSHRLDEIFPLCDRVSVLRDGKLVDTKPVSQTSREELIRLMVGRDVVVPQSAGSAVQSEACLRVDNLCVETKLHEISFEVRRGEILGIGGLVGAGRTELLQTVFGIQPADSGAVFVNGKPVKIRSPKDAIAAGIAYVPEDRKQHGLALKLSMADNFALPNFKSLQYLGFIRHQKKRELAEDYAKRLNIQYRRLDELALLLSGGNQQKIVLGKWLARHPLVLLLDEPTRGIDVAAKTDIYALIRELASSGMAIVLVSSELPELLALSERILVLCEGRIAGELPSRSITEEEVLKLATP